jgi:tRNA-specific 2-thiouridylase
MSGGVDSSVAAALLIEQGFDVVGMMLRLWSEPGKADSNRCCSPEAMALARRVAAQLGIPFYAIDAQEIFRNTVVDYFINGYAQGITPNPCLVCNRQVRWHFLLNHALAFGADSLATGHYARRQACDDGVIQLLRAVDAEKDQSYVLHVLTQSQLKHAVFPIGEYTKDQVRQLARQYRLPVSERQDSQDLCFLAGDDYRHFLQRNAPDIFSPGPTMNTSGEILGQHLGLPFYTIGQRKGLGLSSPHAMYVLKKDVRQNTLIVGGIEETGSAELYAIDINWISGSAPTHPFKANIKTRYTARPAEGLVIPQGETEATVRFDQSLHEITPGQAAVFYTGELCLGGGLISSTT